jgi:MoaA/NifB/PqqE/SkfB family radical SAM enzyme
MRTTAIIQSCIKAGRHFFNNMPLNTVTEVKITRLCNQRCRQCTIYKKKETPPYLSFSQFQKIGKRLRQYGSFVGMISGGEPLLHPDIRAILTHSMEIFPVSVSLVTGLYFPYEKISATISHCLEENINIQTSLDGLGPLGDDIRGVSNYSSTVLNCMEKIAKEKEKRGSNSFLYVNCVLSGKNLEQVHTIIETIQNTGWKTTIGLYQTMTPTTQYDDDMIIRDQESFLKVVEYLQSSPNILNLPTYIEGLPRILTRNYPDFCPFVDGKRTATRLTIMENGDIYLCYGEKIGNLLQDNLENILKGQEYHLRLAEYEQCQGCWSSCFTQKYLLLHPQNIRELICHAESLLSVRTASIYKKKSPVETNNRKEVVNARI